MKATLFIPGQTPEALPLDRWADTRPSHQGEWDLHRVAQLLNCHPSNIDVLDEGARYTILAPTDAADEEDTLENPGATQALLALSGFRLIESLYGPILIIEAE